MIDSFKDKYTPVCDTEIKKCAKSYCKPIDFRPDYYLYKLYTFVELLSVNRYSKDIWLARNIQEIFFHCGYSLWLYIRRTQVQEHKNLFIFILTGLNKKEYSLWQSDLLLLLPDIHSYNHGVFFIQHDQICTTRDVIYTSLNLESSNFKDKLTKYINKFLP